MKKTHIILAAALLVLTACHKDPGIDPVILSSDDFCLEVKGKMVQTFAESECQTGFNESKKQFRVGNDKMSEYYILNCNKVPSRKDETLTANLEWTLNATVQKRSSIKFTVEKVGEDGRIWLWNAKEEIAAVVRKPR